MVFLCECEPVGRVKGIWVMFQIWWLPCWCRLESPVQKTVSAGVDTARAGQICAGCDPAAISRVGWGNGVFWTKPASPCGLQQRLGDSKAADGHKGGTLCYWEAMWCSLGWVGSEVSEQPLPSSPCWRLYIFQRAGGKASAAGRLACCLHHELWSDHRYEENGGRGWANGWRSLG